MRAEIEVTLTMEPRLAVSAGSAARQAYQVPLRALRSKNAVPMSASLKVGSGMRPSMWPALLTSTSRPPVLGHGLGFYAATSGMS